MPFLVGLSRILPTPVRSLSNFFVMTSEIVRRVAIHILDQRFDTLCSLVPLLLTPPIFDTGHLHEFSYLPEKSFPGFFYGRENSDFDDYPRPAAAG